MPGRAVPARAIARDAGARPRRHEVTPGAADRAGALDPGSDGGDAAATLAASRALLEAASVVVVTSDDGDDVAGASAVARRLGIPLLVHGADLAAELDRLGTRTVVRWAPTASGSATPSPSLPASFGDREVVDGTDAGALRELPGLPLTPPRERAVVLVLEGATVPAGIRATLAAVGATQVAVTGTDPRTTAEARAALQGSAATPVLGVGAGFGSAQRFAGRVRTARHAHELPGGGLLPFPGRRMVALYGHPQTAALGMLGEQSATAAVDRVSALAAQYATLTTTPVVPAFELIATVASGSAGEGRVVLAPHARATRCCPGCGPPRRRTSTSCSTSSPAATTS